MTYSVLFKMKNGSDRSCKENQNTFFSMPFPENHAICEKLRKKKHCRHGEITDDNMAHAHCMLDS